MPNSAIVSGAWTQRVVRGLERTGLDVRSLCAARGLDYARLEDPGAWIPTDQLALLWREAVRADSDRHLGLHAGAVLTPSLTTPLSHLISSSRDLLAATHRASELQRIITSRPVLSIERSKDAWAIAVAGGSEAETARHVNEFAVVVLARFAAFLTPGEFQMIRVDLEHPHPGDSAEHERILGCPVQFGRSTNQLLLSHQLMTSPSPHYSAELSIQLQEVATRHVERLAQPGTTGNLRALLRPRLRTAAFEIDEVARALHLSGRTLQRRLRQEGTSFSAVLDATRRELALELVEDGETVAKVAERTGFASKRALLRAFKRWTGTTPREHRARAFPP